jgi:hypothetical protein
MRCYDYDQPTNWERAGNSTIDTFLAMILVGYRRAKVYVYCTTLLRAPEQYSNELYGSEILRRWLSAYSLEMLHPPQAP